MQKGWFTYGPEGGDAQPEGQWTEYDPVARVEQLKGALEINHGMKEYWKKAYREIEDKNNALSKEFDDLREQNDRLRLLLYSSTTTTPPTYRTPTIADIGKAVEVSNDGSEWSKSVTLDPYALYGIVDCCENLRYVVKIYGYEHRYRYARIKE